MEDKRKVDFRILFNLLKSRGPVSVLGIVFPLLAIVVFIPMVVILSFVLVKPFQKYNFKEIESKGTEKTAKITEVKLLTNINDNGRNPQVIAYTYDDKGKQTADKFETMEMDKTAGFDTGKEIKILVYQNQSMIKGIQPYAFPVGIFYLFPVLFGGIGILFLLFSLIPALKTYDLYKTGVVKDAHIISMESSNGFPPLGNFRNKMVLNYYFLDDNQNKVFGESPTTDLMIVSSKKPGDMVKIFVSAANGNKSCLVPNLEAMKYNWVI